MYLFIILFRSAISYTPRGWSVSNLLMNVSGFAHYKHQKHMSSTEQIHKTHQEIIKDNILISHVQKKRHNFRTSCI